MEYRSSNSIEHRQIDHDRTWRYDTLTSDGMQTEVARVVENVDQMIATFEQSDEMTFDATVGSLDYIVAQMAQLSPIASMRDMAPDAAVRAAGQAAYDIYAAAHQALYARSGVYGRIAAFAQTDAANDLPPAQARLLAVELKTLDVVGGWGLDPEVRAEFSRLQSEANQLASQFKEARLAARGEVAFDAQRLDGVSEVVLQTMTIDDDGTARVVIGERGHADAVVRAAHDRSVREQVYLANRKLYDVNIPVVQQITNLRHEMATLLGYESWAAYRLEGSAVQSPAQLRTYYDTIIEDTHQDAAEITEQLTQRLHADGHDGRLQRWDLAYYRDAHFAATLQIDHENVSHYFPFDQTVARVFALQGTVLGIDIQQNVAADSWHESVRVFDVYDTTSHQLLGRFHLDAFEREGRISGVNQARGLTPGCRRRDGSYQLPEAALMLGLKPATGDAPVLMKHKQVVALTHELGHVLHKLLTTVDYAAISGSQVEPDFVEAVSQIQENWAYDATILMQFSSHDETGAPMPQSLAKALEASRIDTDCLYKRARVHLGLYDLAIHSGPDVALDAAWNDASEVMPPERIDGDNAVGHFIHPMMDVYSSRYYTYFISKEMGNQAFERFRREGLVNPDVGADWRRIVLEDGSVTGAADKIALFLADHPPKK
ncbi:MAG: M3 family metallopeptidase [Candidatus Saccharimonadales bacterium]